jgi:hypothetical protein
MWGVSKNERPNEIGILFCKPPLKKWGKKLHTEVPKKQSKNSCP